MPTINLTNSLAAGQPRDVTKIQQNFVDLRTAINGGLDGDNFTSATRQAMGLSDASNIRRGSAVIATSQSIAGTSYAALTTPDRVSNVVVAANSLLLVSYWCVGLKTVGGTSETYSMGLFLNGTQVKSRFGIAPASGVSAGLFEQAGIAGGLAPTTSHCLFTANTDDGFDELFSGNGAPADDTAAGHPVGTFVPIVVAAGTYTVEVRFKKTAGATASIQSRRLYARSEAF